MCGFLVVWDFLGRKISYTPEVNKKTSEYLSSRGPDEFNVVSLTQGYAVHARLSIRGGSNGKQPINTSEDVFVYNGELYDIDTDEASDTTFFYNNLNNFYQHELAIDGIYAAVHVNKKDNTVHLIRDKWGTKPLFYKVEDNILYASSSLRLLATITKPVIDRDAIQEYETLGFFPGSSTPFLDIKKADAGCVLTLTRGLNNAVIKKSLIKDAKHDKLTSHAFQNGLKSQLISDVPVGLLLSGGVDSTILAKLSDENPNIRLFNVTSSSFKNLNERENLDVVEEALVNNITSLEVEIGDINETMQKAIGCLDIPVSDSSIMLNYLIYEKARATNTPVCLTGVGADELFGGYTRYKIIPYSSIISLIGRYLPYTILEKLTKFSNNPRIKRFLLNRCQNYIDLFSDSDIDHTCKYFVPMKKENILSFERKEYLQNALLSFTDGISMAHSVEARVPYLSKHIATTEVLNNDFFTPEKDYLKRFRRRIFNRKFNEDKKGFALKNNELTILHQKISNRSEFGNFVLNQWFENLGICRGYTEG